MFLIPKSFWIVKETKEKGRGVFALKDIEPGVIIGDYIGKVIRVDEEEEYEKKYGFYTMYYHDKATIFADPKKIGIHLLNHSCAPNCWMYTYKGHTLFFSIRKIFKGEELTLSYLIGPQDEDCNPCKDQCKCGSFNCSETMHMSEKQHQAWGDLDDKIAKKTKRERIKYHQILKPLKKYPKRIPDNAFYTLTGSELKKPIVCCDKKLPKKTRIRARIRQTGRFLHFKNLNLTVFGINNNLLLAKSN